MAPAASRYHASVRLAVAGLGFIGSVHVKAILSTPGVELAVISSDPQKLSGDLTGVTGNLSTPGERFDFAGVRKYRDLQSALDDPEIDAIDLCLPSDLHERAAIDCLRAGKHVLVEKPMALSVAGCDRMIEEARRAGRILMVAHVLRFFPSYRAAADAIPKLGQIRSATFRRRCARPTWANWQADPDRSGGAVLDLLIHDLDFVRHVFGPPIEIAATGRVEQDIDLVSAQLTYPGFMVDVTGGWHPGKFPLTMKYRVVGAEASVDFNFNEHPPRIHRNGICENLPMEPRDAFADEIACFVECVRTGRDALACHPAESREAVRLALAIIESRRRGGEKITWKSE